MFYELISEIMGVATILWIGLEIGVIVGRAGALIDIKGTDAYSTMVKLMRVQARYSGMKSWYAKGMLHILNEVKEEGIY